MPEDAVIPDEPPDENEAFASLDESLEEAGGPSGGPEGGLDIDNDLVVDDAELESLGADLDDPDELADPDESAEVADPGGQPD